MLGQAVQNFRREEAQRVVELRANKKKIKEDKRKTVDAANLKKKEKGIRNAPYIASRTFSTSIPLFRIEEEVTNRPITPGAKLRAGSEE